MAERSIGAQRVSVTGKYGDASSPNGTNGLLFALNAFGRDMPLFILLWSGAVAREGHGLHFTVLFRQRGLFSHIRSAPWGPVEWGAADVPRT